MSVRLVRIKMSDLSIVEDVEKLGPSCLLPGCKMVQ